MPLVQSVAYEACADSSTATESEAGETRTLVRHYSQQCRVPNRPPRLAIAGAAAGVFAVAALALLALTGGGGGSPVAEVASLDSAVSAATMPSPRLGYGCSNWETVRLALLTNLTEVQQCLNECAARAGCIGFGYQEDPCGGTEQVGAGSCYLWYSACEVERSECWDDYLMVAGEAKPAPWALNEAKTGCKNWETIKIGDATIEISAGACGTKCSATAECVSWNYQSDPCSGDEMVGRGACYLFKDICEKEDNKCWDVYDQLQLTTLTVDYVSPALSLSVVSEDGFEVGDIITITNTRSTDEVYEQVVLTGVTPLRFEKELMYDYPKDVTTVTTPLKGPPPTTT